MVRPNSRSSQRRIPTRSKSPSAASAAGDNASVEEEGSSSRRGGRRLPAPDNDAEADDVSTLASEGNNDVENDDDNEDDEDEEDTVDEMEVSGRSGMTATRRSTRAVRMRGAGGAKPPPPAKRKTQAKYTSRRTQALASRRSARGRRGGEDDDDEEAAASNDDVETKKRSKKGAGSDEDMDEDEEDTSSSSSENEGDSKVKPETTAIPRRRGRPPKKRPPGSDLDISGEEEDAGSGDVNKNKSDEAGKASTEAPAKPIPKRRGRPPKIRDATKESKGPGGDKDVPGKGGDDNNSENDEEGKARVEKAALAMPRRRGRPPKKRVQTEDESKEPGSGKHAPGEEEVTGSGDESNSANHEVGQPKIDETAKAIPRRRGRPPKKSGPPKEESKEAGSDEDMPWGQAGGGEETNSENGDEGGKASSEMSVKAAPRRRGRPPKKRNEITVSKGAESDEDVPGKVEEAGVAIVKAFPRRRGRPPKNRDANKDEPKEAIDCEIGNVDGGGQDEAGEVLEKPVESDVKSGANQSEDVDGTVDADAGVGSKRQLPMPQRSSKRIKEIDDVEGTGPAHNTHETTSIHADDIVVHPGPKDVIDLPAVARNVMEDLDKGNQMTVASIEEAAQVDATDHATSGNTESSINFESTNPAGDSKESGTDQPVEFPNASLDATLGPTETRGTSDSVIRSLDSRIPRKSMQRLSSIDPASLEPAKSVDAGGGGEAVPSKREVGAAHAAVSPKSNHSDRTLDRGDNFSIEGRSLSAIGRDVEVNVVQGDTLGESQASSTENEISVMNDGQERPRATETDAHRINAQSTSESTTSMTRAIDSRPCEGSESYNDDATSTNSHPSSSKIDEGAVNDHDTEADGKNYSRRNGDAPTSKPDVSLQEEGAEGHLVVTGEVALRDISDERDSVAPVLAISLRIGAADDKVADEAESEVPAAHSGVEPPDSGGISQEEERAVREIVNDVVDAAIADSVSDSKRSTAEAGDLTGKSLVESRCERSANPNAAALMEANTFKESRPGAIFGIVGAPQVHSVPVRLSVADASSTASNLDVAEASSSRGASPSNFDDAKDTLERTLRPRPVPAFRVSKPRSIESRPRPGPKKISLERVKMALFSLGCDAHGRHGFERIFAQYWSSFSAVLHSAGSVASTLRQHRAIVDSFLKTKRLRKLHNKLVLGLLDLYYAAPRDPREDSLRPLPDVCEADVRKYTPDPRNSLQSVSDTGLREKTFPRLSSLTYTAPPFSTLVADPVSKGTTPKNFPVKASICIPGAMAIDPYVRDVASAAGMKVAENAIWLLVAAMKEFAQTALRNCVELKVAVKSGEVPPMPLIRQRVVHRKRDIGNHGSDVSVAGSADAASMNCITAVDVFSLAASMSIGGARSIAGTVSRSAFERALLSSCESNIEPHPEGFDSLKEFIASAISPALLAKVSYDESSPGKPVDSSAVVTSSTVPVSTAKPSLKPRALQGGGGLGRGAKDLGALRARSITQRSAATAADAVSAAASITQIDANQKQEQAQSDDLPSSVAQSDTPSQPLDSVQSVEPAPPVSREPERRPSSEPKSENINLARRGKGFGVKNLAAMRARSITKPTESEDGRAPTDTPSVEREPSPCLLSHSPSTDELRRHDLTDAGLPATTDESQTESSKSDVAPSSGAAASLTAELIDPSTGGGEPTILTECETKAPTSSTGAELPSTSERNRSLSTLTDLAAPSDVMVSSTAEATDQSDVEPATSMAGIAPTPSLLQTNEGTGSVSTATELVDPSGSPASAAEVKTVSSTGDATATSTADTAPTQSIDEAPLPPSGEGRSEGSRGAAIRPTGDEASLSSSALQPGQSAVDEVPVQLHDSMALTAPSDQVHVPDSVPPESAAADPKDASHLQ